MTTPITIFTVPKAFTGEFERIQTNAIRSWKALGATVVLLGNEEGVEKFAWHEKVLWCADVVRNEYGTPLVSDIFKHGQQWATADLVAYVNADIILFLDFYWAVRSCYHELPAFLMCGQRSNTDVALFGDFSDPEVVADMKKHLKPRTTLEGVGASDYFVFRKGDLGDIPPFALGRFRWDNWLMWRALNRGLAFVDATEAVLAVHQNHPPMPRVEGDVEFHTNNALVATDGGRLGRLSDATHQLTANFELVEGARA